MATSAAKSNMPSISVAALLLAMLAMMASTADATFLLKNACTAPITITVQTQVLPLAAVNVTLTANAGSTSVLALPIVGGVVQLVQLKLGTAVYVVPLAQISNLTGVLGLLTQLSVTCDAAPCGHGKISVVVSAFVNFQTVTANICLNV